MKHPNINELTRIIAFDFGMKRIGTAIGDTITHTARPLEVVKANYGAADWVAIDKLIKKWQPDALLLGIPLNMDGTDQFITQNARNFAQELSERYSLPVLEADERLTTKDAREQLFQAGGYKALQDGQVDCMAAKLILETWFISNK